MVKGMNGWPRSAFSMARTTFRPCLLHGRNVTANRTERVCAVIGAKLDPRVSASNLSSEYPARPDGIVNRNGKVTHEVEDFGFMLIEPIKQVLWRGLFPASPSFGQGRRWWQIFGITVRCWKSSDLLRGQGTRLLGGFCNLRFNRQQQLTHLYCQGGMLRTES